jgi:hypothetical protein
VWFAQLTRRSSERFVCLSAEEVVTRTELLERCEHREYPDTHGGQSRGLTVRENRRDR